MTINWAIETFPSLASTMTVAQERGEAQASEGTVIVALEQNAGRGRFGNQWTAPLGNLYFSLLLRPEAFLQLGQYSFIAAVAMAKAIKPLLKINCYQHKWPNDGLLDDKKFAGILLEAGADFINMGIGVNIVSAPEGKTCLNAHANQALTASEFLNCYLDNLDLAITEYRKHGFAPIRSQWLADAKGLHESIVARLPQETMEGIFQDLDENGALILGLADGRQKVIHSGEVYFGNER